MSASRCAEVASSHLPARDSTSGAATPRQSSRRARLTTVFVILSKLRLGARARTSLASRWLGSEASYPLETELGTSITGSFSSGWTSDISSANIPTPRRSQIQCQCPHYPHRRFTQSVVTLIPHSKRKVRSSMTSTFLSLGNRFCTGGVQNAVAATGHAI